MIKARIRWCTCRVENILTLGKLLSLWFRFLLHSILFLISQTSYRTYKIISSYELARPVMGTIFSSFSVKGARTPAHRKYRLPRSRPHLIDHILGAGITLILLFARLLY